MVLIHKIIPLCWQLIDEWQLLHETLYTSVRLVDIFLSRTSNVSKQHFQLLAGTAVWISAKMNVSLPSHNTVS